MQTKPPPSQLPNHPDPQEQMTRRLLVDAGITDGMHVLDVGCGYGAVSAIISGLVGPRGRVLGIDRDERAIHMAREKSEQAGISNVSFEQQDISTLEQGARTFDAIVGRRVLMYVPQQVEALRILATVLRPGGMIIFQEHDATMAPAFLKPMPLHQQVYHWIWKTVEREGANLHTGFDLPQLFTQAGLVFEHIRAEAIVQTPGTDYPLLNIVRAMMPRIFRHNVATAEEIDIDTLPQRLREEHTQTNATFVSDMAFGAWARKPLNDG